MHVDVLIITYMHNIYVCITLAANATESDLD